MNVFPGLMVKHFYVKFGDPSCISFRDIARHTPDCIETAEYIEVVFSRETSLGVFHTFL